MSDHPTPGVPGDHGLTFLPLLGGERSPGWNGRARGAIAGLTFETTPEDILRAALEGVALALAGLAERLAPLDEVVATGGALGANRGWAQLIADALGRPVALSRVDEASARGAAVVTLERLGLSTPPVPLGETLAPRAEHADAFRRAGERQRALYDAVT